MNGVGISINAKKFGGCLHNIDIHVSLSYIIYELLWGRNYFICGSHTGDTPFIFLYYLKIS